jgi:hypothetical protein
MNNIKFTQEDAEYLAEWFNFVNSKSFGILSEEFKNKVIKADIIRGNLTQLMYENSNWRIKRKYRKGKYSKATIEYVSNQTQKHHNRIPSDRMIEILGPIFGIGFLIWLTLAILVLCAVRYFENL